MPPIYESPEKSIADLQAIRKANRCAVCGGWLNVFLDNNPDSPNKGKAFVACNDWPRTHHEGIQREASEYEQKGMDALNIPTRRKIMNKEFGEEKTTVLAKYMGGGIVMTRSIATEIVETLWGDAPLIEKTKCILLCQTYQLNPLMKHIYLIGYKRYENQKLVVDQNGKAVLDWSIQQGIGATRLLAQRKHNYSYMDMTPRKATQEEIDKILGDTADTGSIYGFTHIKDVDTGAEAFGIRGIERDANIKGRDKGNTHLNMACIRSERLCLDRQYPGEMPPNIEVVDERYLESEVEVEGVGKVSTDTGEIIEGEARVLEDEPEPPPEPEPEKPAAQKHKRAENSATTEQITELTKVMDMYGFGLPDIRTFVNEKGWKVGIIGDLSQVQITELTQHIRDKFEGKSEESTAEVAQKELKF